jgi:DMSO/TMAO reductase YedYZ molybdopterin-dependent catalytic subunit
VLAGAFGLAAAHVLTALDRSFRDPAVSVGDRLIDRVPLGVRDWAIRTFGTSDKDVLLVGIYVALVVGSAFIGIAALRGRFGGALVASCAIGAAGAWAAVAAPSVGFAGVVPSAGGTLTTIGALALLRARLHRQRPDGDPGNEVRRRLLLGAGALAVGTVALGAIGRALRDRLGVTAERLGLRLPLADRPRPAAPAGLERDVDGMTRLFTPNDEFYRIDTALFVPNVSTSDWRLRVHGMVDRELSLGYEDVLDRELIETDVTLSCVSNEVGGDLVGNARWLGCRLDDLLREVGVHEEADQVVGRSVDGWTSGFPFDVLDGRDAIVAIGMNGEPLPLRHGYPARLVVPGLYGYVSATKWVTEIELTRFDQFSAYWVPRGWAQRAPIKTESRIDTPRGSVAAGALAIAGVAWAGVRGIGKVEVQIDDGPWQAATLGPELARTTWRQWWLRWDAAPGAHRLTVRATDSEGVTQTPDIAPPAPDGATGWHSRQVSVV